MLHTEKFITPPANGFISLVSDISFKYTVYAFPRRKNSTTKYLDTTTTTYLIKRLNTGR